MKDLWVYYNGNIIPLEEVKISPFDRGYQFGDGVYEVIRFYPSKLFLPELHVERLRSSLDKMQIKFFHLDFIVPTIMELLSKNNQLDKPSIAYLQITRGIQIPRKHDYADELIPSVFMYTAEFPVKFQKQVDGVKVCLDEDIRWHQCDIKSISLIPNAASSQRAKELGCEETIWHREGKITEGTHSNIGFVKNGNVVTPPLSKYILPGITRRTALMICYELGIRVEEREVDVSEIAEFDEAFLLSTTAEVMPIVEFENKKLNNGIPGPVTRALQEAFQKLITG